MDTETSTTSAPTPSNKITTASTHSNLEKSSVTIIKPTPYTFDLGNLLCIDANPLPPSPSEALLKETARDAAQGLVNQLLTTCPIISSPTNGLLMTLPPPTTALPREKPLPAEKQETKWEKFAKKKGIKGKKSGEGKMVYDEAKGEWIPRWGYKGLNKDGDGDWIVEIDEEKEGKMGKGDEVRGEGRRERREKVRRNERRERANERKSRKGQSGG